MFISYVIFQIDFNVLFQILMMFISENKPRFGFSSLKARYKFVYLLTLICCVHLLICIEWMITVSDAVSL